MINGRAKSKGFVMKGGPFAIHDISYRPVQCNNVNTDSGDLFNPLSGNIDLPLHSVYILVQ